MTERESPSALLERAAAHLKLCAAHFEGYQRTAEDDPDQIGSPVQWWAYDTVDRMASQAARRWVETLPPSVAPPLVEWLRETVEQYRVEHSRRTVPSEALDGAWMRHPAVRFSRQVLGES